MAENIKTMSSLYEWALQCSAYIVKNHCTIIEAADHFMVPKSTLWWRLEQLTPTDRAPSLRVAAENKARVCRELNERRKHKC